MRRRKKQAQEKLDAKASGKQDDVEAGGVAPASVQQDPKPWWKMWGPQSVQTLKSDEGKSKPDAVEGKSKPGVPQGLSDASQLAATEQARKAQAQQISSQSAMRNSGDQAMHAIYHHYFVLLSTYAKGD